jgi:hypothetical protein
MVESLECMQEAGPETALAVTRVRERRSGHEQGQQ